MTDTLDPVVPLTEEESLERMRSQQLGRLVTRVGDVVDIFPVNFALDGRSILFRTAPGSKLAELTISEQVLFETDHADEVEAWSVVIHGTARTLDTFDEVAAADALGLVPWIPTLKYVWVRVEPATVTGRYFRRGPEPERYGVQDY